MDAAPVVIDTIGSVLARYSDELHRKYLNNEFTGDEVARLQKFVDKIPFMCEMCCRWFYIKKNKLCNQCTKLAHLSTLKQSLTAAIASLGDEQATALLEPLAESITETSELLDARRDEKRLQGLERAIQGAPWERDEDEWSEERDGKDAKDGDAPSDSEDEAPSEPDDDPSDNKSGSQADAEVEDPNDPSIALADLGQSSSSSEDSGSEDDSAAAAAPVGPIGPSGPPVARGPVRPPVRLVARGYGNISVYPELAGSLRPSGSAGAVDHKHSAPFTTASIKRQSRLKAIVSESEEESEADDVVSEDEDQKVGNSRKKTQNGYNIRKRVKKIDYKEKHEDDEDL